MNFTCLFYMQQSNMTYALKHIYGIMVMQTDNDVKIIISEEIGLLVIIHNVSLFKTLINIH